VYFSSLKTTKLSCDMHILLVIAFNWHTRHLSRYRLQDISLRCLVLLPVPCGLAVCIIPKRYVTYSIWLRRSYALQICILCSSSFQRLHLQTLEIKTDIVTTYTCDLFFFTSIRIFTKLLNKENNWNCIYKLRVITAIQTFNWINMLPKLKKKKKK
jgi:hypothetical protein